MHVTTDECEGFKSSFIKFHPPVTAGVAGGPPCNCRSCRGLDSRLGM